MRNEINYYLESILHELVFEIIDVKYVWAFLQQYNMQYVLVVIDELHC